jgi:hypothetical protein
VGLCCHGFGCHEVGIAMGLVAVRYGWSVEKKYVKYKKKKNYFIIFKYDVL